MAKTENTKPDNGKDQLEGRQLDDAILAQIANDKTPGEAAAVLREVARLHQENITLKKRNVRVWGLALTLGATFAVSVSSALFLFPKYRYIPTTDNRALCAVSSDAQVRVTPAALTEPRRPPKVPHLWPPKLLHPAGGDLMH